MAWRNVDLATPLLGRQLACALDLKGLTSARQSKLLGGRKAWPRLKTGSQCCGLQVRTSSAVRPS
jgi:hypothetical protein